MDSTGTVKPDLTPEMIMCDPEKLENQPDSSKSLLAEYKRPFNNVKWGFICAGLFVGAILFGLDTSIAAVVQGPIIESLGEVEKLGWVGIGFPLGSVAVILFFGQLYDLFEIKYLIIGSVFLFEIGSILCGAAKDMNSMIIGRVIGGAGGGGMYLGALTYIAVFTSHRERPIYDGLIGLCWGVGCILGPIIGGTFSDSSATWRWGFYINLPVAAVLAPIFVFLYPKHNPNQNLTNAKKLQQLDWVGIVLNMGVFAFFIIVLSFAGSIWKWNSPNIITLWVIFGVVLVVFIFQQIFSIFTTPEYRIFPVQFLKRRHMLLVYAGTAAAGSALAVGIIYLPLFFQITKGDSAIQAGLRLLPFICSLVVSIMFAGVGVSLLGRYAPMYIASGLFMIAGGALMYTVNTSTPTSAIYGYQVLLGIGAGLTMQVGYSVAAAKVHANEAQASIGFINVAQMGSDAIGLSIAGAVFQNLGFSNLRTALAVYDFSEEDLRGALGGTWSAVLASTDGEAVKLATDAIVLTISKVWILLIISGVVSVGSGLLMSWEKLDLEMFVGG